MRIATSGEIITHNIAAAEQSLCDCRQLRVLGHLEALLLGLQHLALPLNLYRFINLSKVIGFQ
jgi:hypothetical protein